MLRFMPATIAILFIFAGLNLVAPPTRAALSRQDAGVIARRAIQSIYDRQDRAAAHKDLGGVFAQTAPNFLAIDENGQTISLAQAKANIEQLFSQAQSVTSTTTIAKFRVVGNRAYVTAKSRDVVVFTDPNTGQAGKVTVDDVSVDTWERFGRTWLQTRSHDISQAVHRDEPASPPAYDPMLS